MQRSKRHPPSATLKTPLDPSPVPYAVENYPSSVSVILGYLAGASVLLHVGLLTLERLEVIGN